MRCDQQSLSYPLRLPDEMQASALRLLDVSRETINLAITALWNRLDEFATRTNRHAYKQVEALLAAPQVHGHRQQSLLQWLVCFCSSSLLVRYPDHASVM